MSGFDWGVTVIGVLLATPVVLVVAYYAVSYPIDFAKGFATGTGAFVIAGEVLEHIGPQRFSWSDLVHWSIVVGGTAGGVILAAQVSQQRPSWWKVWRAQRKARATPPGGVQRGSSPPSGTP